MESLTRIAFRVNFVAILLIAVASNAYSDERPKTNESKVVSRVKFKNAKSPLTQVSGLVVAEGEDGGCLLQESSGRLRVIVAKESQSIEATQEPFVPMSLERMAEAMLHELPKGFHTTTTKHYVICYNTTDAYAKWNGSMYERLFKAFYTYWSQRGVPLHEPEFPLVAVVFETRNGYVRYAEKEEIANAESMIGYYNQLSNRIAGYDLTGIEGMIPAGKSVNTADLVNHILAQPSAERSVATIVHEAVHQLAYNSGLQRRLGDNPVAISEGLAMFFESPDLRSPSGWGGIGNINRYNLAVFKNAFPSRETNSLVKLLQDDSLFHDSSTTTAAYGESWALTYFLMKAKTKEFALYLKELRDRPPLEPIDPKRRIADFQKHFGSDFEKLDRDFVKFMSRL